MTGVKYPVPIVNVVVFGNGHRANLELTLFLFDAGFAPVGEERVEWMPYQLSKAST